MKKTKLRCHVFMSPSRREFYDKHFAPTVPKGLQVILHKWPRKWNDVVYGTSEFNLCMQWGVQKLIKLCRTERRPFLLSDVDVRFYGEVADDLLKCLDKYDLAFQNDGTGGACKGFFMCRPTRARWAALFFQRVLSAMKLSGKNDQEETNACLKTRGTILSWRLLPKRYWTHGCDTGKKWNPGDPLDPPADMLMHHANWTHGVGNKLKLLDAVKDIMDCRGLLGSTRAVVPKPPALPSGPIHLIERHPMGATVAAQILIEQERAKHATKHHSLPLAIVLQFYPGDFREAADLARFLADIEPEYRGDVALVLARDGSMPLNQTLIDLAVYCAQKFPVRHLRCEVRKGARDPDAANQAWASACQQLSDSDHTGEAPHADLFFCEADGCPLTCDWIDRIKDAHANSLARDKWVTGARSWDGFRLHQHINGTLVLNVTFWENTPSLRRTPPSTGWDGFHGRVLCGAAGPSTIIRNEYGLIGVTEASFRQMGHMSAWLTSVKDQTHQFWARRNLLR